MKQKWENYEEAAKKGPMTLIIKVIVAIFIIGIFISVIGYGLGWFGETAHVVKKEFGPEVILEKYEWFKDASAQLDKKRADIEIYEQRVSNMESDYEGTERKNWDRTDKEQFNQWQTEVAGVKASYNGLAAEYNAQMKKFNWRFANRGELPEGAAEVLPREYRSYTSQ